MRVSIIDEDIYHDWGTLSSIEASIINGGGDILPVSGTIINEVPFQQ